MSLPRRRPSEHRAYQLPAAFAREPDFTVIMPAVRKLREAGDDRFAIEDAFEAIPMHLLGRVAVFAGERNDILPWRLVREMLDLVGFDTLCGDVGGQRASVVWRRYHTG